jgi:four helix bundle protein
MTGYEKFIAWQKTSVMAKEIYRLTSLDEFAKDFGLRDQIRFAAVSILSKIT